MKRIVLLCVLVACGRKDVGPGAEKAAAEFADALPDADAFVLGDETSPARDEASGPARHVVAEKSVIAGPSAEEIQKINAQIKEVFAAIREAVADVNPTQKTLAAHVWVIELKSGITLRFTLRRGGVGRFGWKAEVKKTGDFVVVAAGTLRRDKAVATPGRGAVTIGLDFDAFAAAAAGSNAGTAVKARGKLFASGRHGVRGSHLRYRLVGFTPDPETRPGTDAYFDILRGGAPVILKARAAGQASLHTFVDNLGGSDTSALESFHARVRRVKSLGGYARAVAWGGDLAAGHAYYARECWSAADAVVYRRVWDCTYTADTPLAFASACTLVTATAASVGAESATPTTNNPLDASNYGAFKTACFPDVPMFARTTAVDGAATDLSAETVVLAGDATLAAGADTQASDASAGGPPPSESTGAAEDPAAPPAELPSGEPDSE